ncbi:MAG: macro domain-containing protein [Thermoplasmata archaeon]|nr:MAG: macro domain-containing protein [Thermoplasmata archaeon]
MQLRINKTMIHLKEGDLTEITADAIVNAANNQLWMGGGVAGAIKRKGGKEIEDEAVKKGPIPIGEAVATTAGKLNAKYVIHAAGMGTDLRTDGNKIREATVNSLKRANELGIESIAFPSIGTGVGGFSMDSAADIMLRAALEHARGKTTLKSIIFVLYGKTAYEAFERVLSSL